MQKKNRKVSSLAISKMECRRATARLMIDFGTPCHKNRFATLRIFWLQTPCVRLDYAQTLLDISDADSTPFPPDREPMSVEQALRAVTIDAAWQLRMENKIGSLEVGKYADIVVLDGNPYAVEPARIADINVLMTMMDGRFTHKAD